MDLTQHPQRSALECKKCFKLEKVRDGVKGAREWARSMDLTAHKGELNKQEEDVRQRSDSTAAEADSQGQPAK